jgi:hypothetical protein
MCKLLGYTRAEIRDPPELSKSSVVFKREQERVSWATINERTLSRSSFFVRDIDVVQMLALRLPS